MQEIVGVTTMNYRERAIKYLNTGFKSRAQVEEYLKKKEATAEEIADAVGFLAELGYLNDRRFACLTFKAEYEKGRGQARTKMLLKSKGLDSSDIENGYYDFVDQYEMDVDEKAMALKQARVIASGQKLDERLKGKIARRLANKGFGSQTIYYALNNLSEEEEM